MKLRTFALASLLIGASLALPFPAFAQQTRKPGAVAPLKPAVKLGELRIRIFGLTTEQMASNLPLIFQLYQSDIPYFEAWQTVSGFTSNAIGRSGDVSWYAEGDTLFIKGLKPGVYDLHLKSNFRPGYGFTCRPVHINGIVVPPGNPVILEDLRLQKGETVVEIGKPTILPDPAVNIVEKFNELLQRFDALTQRVEKLERENAELRQKLAKP